ncbi:MAG: phosphohistidine phosphatase SixA [bacterium]|nr:phosphohistidine phosphatase SixA [bacterium]
MELILVRHGLAVKRETPGYIDAERPLTQEGIERMQKGARGLASLVDPPDMIVSSPLLRAQQTAEILAVALQCNHEVAEWEALLPDAPPSAILALLRKQDRSGKSVILVGHEPHLSRCAAHLIGSEPLSFQFKKGGAGAFEFPSRLAQGAAVLKWFLTPKQLRQLG